MSNGTKLIQQGLTELGYTGRTGRPLTVDGLFGANTEHATREWLAADGAPKPDTSATGQWPKQSDVTRVFGPAGGAEATAGRCRLPFSFPLAWDADQRISSFSCHRLVAEPLTRIFAEAAAYFGETTFRDMRLDRFGGCFNYRPMRGGTSLSTHSWGIAVDLDPINNGLNTRAPAALFSRPEYEPFWKLVEAEGAVSLGRAIGRDWMHFQFARL